MSANEIYTLKIKRFLDIIVVFAALVLLPIATIAAFLVKITSKGPVLYWSDRVGQNNNTFSMPKFRSMKLETPEVATHLLENPSAHLTVIGGFLRRTSLDELPQLWCVLVGDMSIVGPRPALFNQDELIKLRTEAHVHSLKPGITGWAQVNGRDEISIPEKVIFDTRYMQKQSFMLDVKIVWMTIAQVLQKKAVSH